MIKLLKDNLFLIIIVVLSFIIVGPLFIPGYFPHHDDLQVIRIYEIRRCFEDLQLPCRWAPDMGYGYGYPIFNYYSTLPFYLGAILSYPLGYLGAAKALFFIPLFFAGIFMYFLGREFFGKMGGFIAGVMYLYAPYRSVDAYVRGAVAESFSLLIAPLVFLFGFRLLKEVSVLNFVGASISLASLLITHNIMTLFFIPFYFSFLVIILIFNKWRNLMEVILSMALGIGLSTFFLMPVFLEKSLVQIDSLKGLGFNFAGHFVTLNQMFFDRSWGYGASVFGPEDGMSFQIGWPHWQIAFIAFFIAILVILMSTKRKVFSYIRFVFENSDPFKAILTLFLFAFFVFSAFMMHNKSGFIWESSSSLQFAQFPWRFLSISIFTSSLLAGFFISVWKFRLQQILALLVFVLAISLNISFFRPEKHYLDVTEQDKLSGEWWDVQQRAGILDYLPKTAYEPKEPAPSRGFVIDGDAELTNLEIKSNSWKIKVDAKKDSKLAVPVFDFPDWNVYANGRRINHDNSATIGLITFKLPQGNYQVVGKFEDTAVRKIANSISLISVVLLIVVSRRLIKDGRHEPRSC